MATKLYVGNLSYSTTDDSLKNAFAQAGAVVSASVLVDRMSGRSRGFGFVEMEEADAAKALKCGTTRSLTDENFESMRHGRWLNALRDVLTAAVVEMTTAEATAEAFSFCPR